MICIFCCPFFFQVDDFYYNFWQDADHVQLGSFLYNQRLRKEGDLAAMQLGGVPEACSRDRMGAGAGFGSAECL